MKRLNRLFFLLLIFCGAANLATAQAPQLQQLVFSTGGSFMGPGNYVKLGTWDPLQQQVSYHDSLLGDFSNAVAVSGSNTFLHVGRATGHSEGPDIIVKYDDQMARQGVVTGMGGINSMAKHGDYLLVTHGFGGGGLVFSLIDQETLDVELQYVDTTGATVGGGAVVLRDTAYVAMNRGGIGYLATFALEPTIAAGSVVQLDTLQESINGVFTDGHRIYLLHERYDQATFQLLYAGVTAFDPIENTYRTTLTPAANSGVRYFDGYIWGNFGNGLQGFDTRTMQLDPQFLLPSSISFTRAAYDIYDQYRFYQQSDFWSYGNVVVRDSNLAAIDSFGTDIAGSGLALDYGTIENAKPEPDFTASATMVKERDTVLFQEQVDGHVAEFIWRIWPNSYSYVNGTDSTSPDPEVVFHTEGNYTVSLTAVNHQGVENETKWNLIQVRSSTGLAETPATALKVWPNPAREMLHIQLPEEMKPQQVQILDGTGRVVQNTEVSTGTVQVSHLQPGHYVLRVITQGGVDNQMFLKQ